VNTDYQLIYDVTQASPPYWFPAAGLVGVVLGALLWLFGARLPAARRGPWRSPRSQKIFAAVFLGFSVLWTAGAAATVLGEDCAGRRALQSGTDRVVEGPVQEFHPMPYEGHDTERFRVADVRFAYSDYILEGGFNRTSSHGGPIREGLMVRIHYSGQPSHATILRLEVRD
jgi:hypothetical protein